MWNVGDWITLLVGTKNHHAFIEAGGNLEDTRKRKLFPSSFGCIICRAAQTLITRLLKEID